MACKFIEGFEVYGTFATLQEKLDVPLTSSLVAGRFFGKSLLILSNNNVILSLQDMSNFNGSDFATETSIFIGMAIYFYSLSNTPIVKFIGPTATYVNFCINVNGQIVVKSNAGVYLGSSIATIAPKVWYYIEFKALPAFNGSVQVRVNQTEILNLTNVNTVDATNSFGDSFGYPVYCISVGPDNTSNILIDDIAIGDSNRTHNTDFFGDIIVQGMVPSANGDYTQFPHVIGALDHFSAVDNVPPDGNATYLYATPSDPPVSGSPGPGVAFMDTFKITPFFQPAIIPNTSFLSGNIIAVMENFVVAQDGTSNSLSVNAVISQGLTHVYNGFLYQYPTDGQYHMYDNFWELNPATNTPWTLSTLSGSSFGILYQGGP